MEETKCHPEWPLKDDEAAALYKQLEELNLTDKTGNYIAASKIIHWLCSGENARRVVITPSQEKEIKLYLSTETTLVHLLTMIIVWLHRITTTADEDQDSCLINFQYLER